jgi:hypothetical protein
LVHRAEVMQFRGEWSDALDEIKRAADLVADPQNAYREADEHGRQQSQPGLRVPRN